MPVSAEVHFRMFNKPVTAGSNGVALKHQKDAYGNNRDHTVSVYLPYCTYIQHLYSTLWEGGRRLEKSILCMLAKRLKIVDHP